jgi:hypothetical protein
VTAAVSTRPRPVSRDVALIARRPWMLPAVAAAIGWAAWPVVTVASGIGGHGHVHHLLVTSAMTLAMMGPLGLPVCVAASRSSLWTASARAAVVAFATFIAVWIAVGGALHVATELAIAAAPGGAVAVALALWCAADASSRPRDRRLAACAVSRPLLPHAPLSGAIDLGATAAARCVATCWAPMALAVAHPALGVPVSAAILLERFVTPRPRWLLTVGFGLVSIGVLVITGS